MKLAPVDVNAWRAVARWGMRGVAVVFAATGAYLMLKRILFGIANGWQLALQNWMEIGEQHSFYRGASMIAVGIALGALSTRLSRWIVTVPSQSCPRCGYAQLPAPGDRCPECGLRHESSER